MHSLDALTRRHVIAERITRRSRVQGVEVLDALLNAADGCDQHARTFFAEARAEAEQILTNGYRLTKFSVLLPIGLFGLFQGFAFPDRDIQLLGIGHHRFFLFHSAGAVIVLNRLYQEWMLRQTNPEAWLSRVKRKVGGAAVGGFALGVGLHLAVDVFQPKAVLFPFHGSLVPGTLLDDNIWLLANSVFAFRIAADVFAYAFAEELSRARDIVAERFEGVTAMPELR